MTQYCIRHCQSSTSSICHSPSAPCHHIIGVVGSDVGHSPWQVRWSGTCCLIISVTHRSASDIFDQHWKHSFSQRIGTRSAVEALCVMRYTNRQSTFIIVIIIIMQRERIPIRLSISLPQVAGLLYILSSPAFPAILWTRKPSLEVTLTTLAMYSSSDCEVCPMTVMLNLTLVVSRWTRIANI